MALMRLEDIVMEVLNFPADNDGIRELQRQLFRLSLSSRTFSPAVQMTNHLASVGHLTVPPEVDTNSVTNAINVSSTYLPSPCPDSSSWAQVGSSFVCNLNDLETFLILESAKCSPECSLSHMDTILLSDCVYPSTNNVAKQNSLPRIILNGDIRTKEFYRWHAEAKSFATAGRCVYIFRHYIKESSASNTALNGYGVELALKSTEYKAIDDSTTKASEAKDSTSDNAKGADLLNASNSVVEGFNSIQPHPDLSSTTEIRPLKAGQMRDLGLQAAQSIADAVAQSHGSTAARSGLLALRDISRNFPSRAFGLSQLPLTPELLSEVKYNQAILAERYEVTPGSSLFLLNGLALSPSIDIFALLDILRSESYLLSHLRGLDLPTHEATHLLHSTARADSPSLGVFGESFKHSLTGQYLLNLASAPITYLNDLETNVGYNRWPRTLRALFMPSYMGAIRQVGKNVLNLVLVLDPAEPRCIEMLKLTESFILQGVAIRIGILWAVDPRVDSVGLDLARAFTYLEKMVEEYPRNRRSSSQMGYPGAMTGLNFLTDVYAKVKNLESTSALTQKLVRQEFEHSFPDFYSEDVFGSSDAPTPNDEIIKTHRLFVESSGILSSIGVPPALLMNGMLLDAEGFAKLGGFEDAVVTTAMEQTVYFQHAMLGGRFGDPDSSVDLFTKDGLLITRCNRRLLTAVPPSVNKFSVGDSTLDTDVPTFLPFGSMRDKFKNDSLDSLSSGQITNLLADQMRYLQKGDLENNIRPTTIWVVLGDVEPNEDVPATASLDMLESAARFMRKQASANTRLGFIFNPTVRVKSGGSHRAVEWGDPHWLTRALLLTGQPSEQLLTAKDDSPPPKYMNMMAAKNFAIKLAGEMRSVFNERRKVSTFSKLSVGGLEDSKFLDAFSKLDFERIMDLHATFSRKVLHLNPGRRAVIINGRVYGPLEENEIFVEEDFWLAEHLSKSAGTEGLAGALQKILPPATSTSRISELVWRVSSVLESTNWRLSAFAKSLASEGIFVNGTTNRIALKNLKMKTSAFHVPPTKNGLSYDIVAIVDPASRDAQRLSHILLVLQEALPCNITVILNPQRELSDLPLKNFYRFVWEPTLLDKVDQVALPSAHFEHLPGKSLLTLAIDAPHNWMVAATKTLEDLDNIRMTDVVSRTGDQVIDAEFTLEYLLLEGHCLDETTRQPPRGLQFTLGTADNLQKHDTIVMANLGYFQLKANPGAWYLNLRKGKSKDIYKITGHEYADNPVGSESVTAVIDSFRPKIIRVNVAKKPGHLKESVLGADSDGESVSYESDSQVLDQNSYSRTLSAFWTLLGSWMDVIRSRLTCFRSTDQPSNATRETINIFSLASGHLYERFLRIMMLSVIENTNSTVKFWFLKNYLSPSFKEFIPHMAAEYGFEYELVQYQWPRWLHPQTEKQRIIWGYKILFLDVLFPLSVKKIIYVDADQVVRADLQELVDLDLGGAPYGYTPFCDSRKEMEGFRFWKHGYWAAHLGERPYHISALYVVDLVRFRKMAAGDRLRGQYHALSQDPNSLSNLDQDLPNNMIHQVPIKSLPQEWLWCETWCSDESKQDAKTIDLCNNPMTKEPKLSAAIRIIPNWGKYDQEIKKLQARVAERRSKLERLSSFTVLENTTVAPSLELRMTTEEFPDKQPKDKKKTEL
uniref:UDP-glucose:glycoprotein glucosyltransferase 1 n=1 Tax=Schistocephalus solidus TaxID=70667 RepID=A0A0X3PJY9_SCHSO